MLYLYTILFWASIRELIFNSISGIVLMTYSCIFYLSIITILCLTYSLQPHLKKYTSFLTTVKTQLYSIDFGPRSG